MDWMHRKETANHPQVTPRRWTLRFRTGLQSRGDQSSVGNWRPHLSIFDDPLGRLAAPPVGINRRISSNEQPLWNDGNFDMTVLAPGQTLELPVLVGPGVINHIWFTSHAGGMNELNALSMRIYWDGRDEPGIEVPVAEFFAVGQGKPAVVESMPVQVSPTGSLTCYWRMPFAKSARIVIRNDNEDRSSGLYWQVDWVELDSLPVDTPYFHAQYRQEYPAAIGRDYLIADIEGCGSYVGTVMSITMGQDGWFGEGDDFFYIDGEEVPSLQGTGSEDYFNDAWGFRPRSSMWFGQPRWTGWKAGDHGICYRWHVLDPVGFQKSLKVTMEHKGNCDDSVNGWYFERPDFFNSIAFWYQTGLPKRFGYLPPWPERSVPWHTQNLVRSFKTASVLPFTEGQSRPISVQTTGFFGGRPALVWERAKLDESLTLPFTCASAGRFAVRLVALKSSDAGKFDILIDDAIALAAVDFHAAEEEEADLLLGVHILSEGPHRLAFRAVGTDSGRIVHLAVETIRLLDLPPEAGREVKNHNEAHFVRLGIGRATYAYRLAYGELPTSLEALVEAGIMEERYLTDENFLPMTCHREPDRLVVHAPNWTHHWFGLDARR